VVKPVVSVSVRELIEFVLRRGDLGGEQLFTGPARALAGLRGHQQIQRNRPDGYEKEVPVLYEVEADEFRLRVQGRIDGVQASTNGVLLEEIKTVQGGWAGQPDPLHWAQARFYGFILAEKHAYENILIQLTYLNLDSGDVTEFRQSFALADLSLFFQETTAVYMEWIREQRRWAERRNRSINALEFPYPQYRSGQRELAVAVYRAVAGGGRLFVEAPTGIGKTMSVLFPALKALAKGRLERVFYLTARTTGRTAAEQALTELRGAGLRLRALTLTAKEKICVREGRRCEFESCPLARGYYDRLKPAMREALSCESLTRSSIEAVSRIHQVCPFEFSLDLSLWADAIICDYNYVFDPKVYLRRHFADESAACAFLVDEAHNLVDRAREMYSAGLESRQIREARRALKESLPRCARALSKLGSNLGKLGQTPGLLASASAEAATPDEPDLPLFRESDVAVPQSGSDRDRSQTREGGVQVFRELPGLLAPLVEKALKEAELWLARNEPAEFREMLLELYFRLHSFLRTMELYDECYVTLVTPGALGSVKLFCLDPSRLVGQALKRGQAAVFFSATLAPLEYYRSLLGGTLEDPVLQLPSPFAPERLAVLVHERIRTEFRSRDGTYDEVAQAVAAVVREQPGNYIVYFPSYKYLGSVRERFELFYPSIPLLAQRPNMSEAERDQFLGRFSIENGAALVGFAVLGGVFGEGIDLTGERLIGVVVVGVGLPQLTTERDLVRDYFQELIGAGFDYAYTFPGMNRVLQAAGRVIRSEADRGVVVLIDSRFAQARYRRLFPGWWRPARVRERKGLETELRNFWGLADDQGKL
jgi:DNA excision repair protein ERCC-2